MSGQSLCCVEKSDLYFLCVFICEFPDWKRGRVSREGFHPDAVEGVVLCLPCCICRPALEGSQQGSEGSLCVVRGYSVGREASTVYRQPVWWLLVELCPPPRGGNKGIGGYTPPRGGNKVQLVIG